MTILGKSWNKLSEIFKEKKSKEKIDPSRFDCQNRRAQEKNISPRDSPSTSSSSSDSIPSRKNVCQREVDIEYLLLRQGNMKNRRKPQKADHGPHVTYKKTKYQKVRTSILNAAKATPTKISRSMRPSFATVVMQLS